MRTPSRDEFPHLEGNKVNSFVMDQVRALFGGVCWKCGSRILLEFAHLKPTGLIGRGRGIRSRFFDIRKYPECYALLCRSCHRAHDFNSGRGWSTDLIGPVPQLPSDGSPDEDPDELEAIA